MEKFDNDNKSSYFLRDKTEVHAIHIMHPCIVTNVEAEHKKIFDFLNKK